MEFWGAVMCRHQGSKANGSASTPDVLCILCVTCSTDTALGKLPLGQVAPGKQTLGTALCVWTKAQVHLYSYLGCKLLMCNFEPVLAILLSLHGWFSPTSQIQGVLKFLGQQIPTGYGWAALFWPFIELGLVWFLFIGNYLYTNFHLLNILPFCIAAEHLTDVISSS